MFMPRMRSARPAPMPLFSKRLGFGRQFVEIPDDAALTTDCLGRTARLSVFKLLLIDRKVPREAPHAKAHQAQFAAVITAYR